MFTQTVSRTLRVKPAVVWSRAEKSSSWQYKGKSDNLRLALLEHMMGQQRSCNSPGSTCHLLHLLQGTLQESKSGGTVTGTQEPTAERPTSSKGLEQKDRKAVG